MEPAVIDSISPVLTYKSSTKFHWVEDFEDFSISLEKTGITRTIDTLTITNLPSEVFEFNKPGNRYSGKVNFRSKKGTFENSSIEIFDLATINFRHISGSKLQIGCSSSVWIVSYKWHHY